MALFSTVPFDETTLQGYDMFILLLLLAVFLLPTRTIFLFFSLCVGVIIGTLFTMPLSPALKADLDARMLIVLARPIGTLFVGGGIAYVVAISLTQAIIRANKAEAIVKLEQEQAQLRRNLENGIDQILQTHVEVANGNLNVRAPLNQDNILWQIARALNILLVRFQRATQSEQELRRVEQAVQRTVQAVQEADQRREKPRLPFTRTEIDPLIAALQGQSIGYAPPSIAEHSSTSNTPRDENTMSPYRSRQW
jgi:hypothetical protein